MADFAAVIGILGVCIQLTEGIVKYATAFKHANTQAQALVTEVASVDHVLGALRKHLEQEHRKGQTVFEQTSVLFFAVDGCRDRLQEIHKALQPLAASSMVQRLWGRATWPFEKAGTTEAVIALHRFAQIFHFAMSLEGFKALCQPQNPDALAKIQTSLNTIEQHQTNYNDANIQTILNMVKDMPDLVNDMKLVKKFVHDLEIDNRLKQLLDGIPKLPYGERHRDLQLTRLDGVGRWLFDTSRFVQWRDMTSSEGTLWCNGAPGVGKTHLASIAIDHLHNFTVQSNRRVVYFYFDYKLQSDQTPLNVIQTLLHQLLSKFTHVPAQAVELSQAIAKREELPGWDKLTSIFLKICNDTQDVFVVLDALDECDKVANRGPIVKFIQGIKASKARLMVTSRPYPADVTEVLGSCPQLLIEASDSDITAYVQDRIACNPQTARMIDDSLKDKIIHTITSRSGGMFLLPALQMQVILGQTTRSQIEEALDTLPIGLGENLLLTMERIKSQDPHTKTRAKLALTVLMWLSSAQSLLTVHELQHAIATDSSSMKLGDIIDAEILVDCCFGLVIIDESSVIRLVHFSVSEFLEERRDELFKHPHSTLAATCLSYILLSLQANDSLRSELPYKTPPHWPFLNYSIAHWGMHAKLARPESESVAVMNSKVHDFFASPNTVTFWARTVEDQIHHQRYAIESWWRRHHGWITTPPSHIHIAAMYGLTSLVQDQIKVQPTSMAWRDKCERTILMLAAAEGHLDIVGLLISKGGTDVNAQDWEGNTAFCYAILFQQWEVVRQMLFSKSHVDINLGCPFPMLVDLLTQRDASEAEVSEAGDIIMLLLAHNDLDVNAHGPHDVFEKDPWYRLAQNFQVEILRKLVAHPSFNPWRSGGLAYRVGELSKDYMHREYTPRTDTYLIPAIVRLLENDHRFVLAEFLVLRLLWPFTYYADVKLEPACRHAIDWMTIKYDEIHDRGSDVQRLLESCQHPLTFRDAAGRSFLHHLARMDEDEFTKGQLEYLLEKLPADLRDDRGRTALHFAAESGREHAASRLLDAGADLLALDEDGMSVLHYAVQSQNVDLVKFLIDKGADVNAKTVFGESILHKSAGAFRSTQMMTTILLESSIATSEEDSFGLTPLHLACFYGNPEPAAALLRVGADPAHWSGSRGTPLTEAVCKGNASLARLCLSEYRGDLNVMDIFGMSVFDYLEQQPPNMAKDIGFRTVHWLTYKPTQPEHRRRRIISCLTEKLELMLSANDRNRKLLAISLASQLLKLGDDAAALTMLEARMEHKSKRGTPYFPHDFCKSCSEEHEGVLFKCKRCPYIWICEDCRDDGERWCGCWDFLPVPGDGWKDLPEGIVNEQGQSFDEWLRELYNRYSVIERSLAGRPCADSPAVTYTEEICKTRKKQAHGRDFPSIPPSPVIGRPEKRARNSNSGNQLPNSIGSEDNENHVQQEMPDEKSRIHLQNIQGAQDSINVSINVKDNGHVKLEIMPGEQNRVFPHNSEGTQNQPIVIDDPDDNLTSTLNLQGHLRLQPDAPRDSSPNTLIKDYRDQLRFSEVLSRFQLDDNQSLSARSEAWRRELVTALETKEIIALEVTDDDILNFMEDEERLRSLGTERTNLETARRALAVMGRD
ncbi:hypothetical protein LTR84_000796 [Exophiala bonariae]|uniref:NACHT domain-containing protein n=1 Tax=Exophiala bonariae TaxID=1690606 RepID=A0AAV9NS42_9EURO|nr:hypothetical protein LTR84_000796 [Exophiala bonariae]